MTAQRLGATTCSAGGEGGARTGKLEAILYRYDTTVEEIVVGHEPPLVAAEGAAEDAWREAWDEIVLDLTSGD